MSGLPITMAGMNRVGLLIFVAVVFSSTFAGLCWSAENEPAELGVRVGAGEASESKEFHLYEVQGSIPLPWALEWPDSQGLLGVRANAALGMMRTGGDSGVYVYLGPALRFGRQKWWVEAGTAPTVIAEDRIGGEDLGGPFQITSHLGVGYRFTDRWSTGFRIQHMSNADIYTRNPGLDYGTLEVNYRY
ncbi:MAG: acyloxyacyl hydrolase [Candidatus Omnitrophica bacterium]|nr:acyloxyacyl hydrolase [Candidatus Omnitrophota bacterium]